ncbi:MAG: radical SAM protein [Spirochaetaceae bacterium]|nr:radical SAM protein [Spirochaetaceae bacterium]
MNNNNTRRQERWVALENTLMHYLPNWLRRLGRPAWSKLTENLSLKKKSALALEVHIVEHCNLNCAYCTHFSPIAGQSFVDVDALEKDFKRLGELTGGRVQKLTLMGGEPLLHPRITDIIKMTARHFDFAPPRKSSVHEGGIILTNGLLLLKQSEEFWEACACANISVSISPYPIKLDIDMIKAKAKEHGVVFNAGGGARKTMIRIPLDIEGRQNIEATFRKCGQKNKCVNLKNGRLFTCPTAAHIHHFNSYFNKNLETSEKDYIDIHGASNIDQILDFLRKPIPFCRYCDYARADWNLKWKATQKDIREWT